MAGPAPSNVGWEYEAGLASCLALRQQTWTSPLIYGSRLSHLCNEMIGVHDDSCSLCVCVCVCVCFLGLHLRHMEVPRLGV